MKESEKNIIDDVISVLQYKKSENGDLYAIWDILVNLNQGRTDVAKRISKSYKDVFLNKSIEK